MTLRSEARTRLAERATKLRAPLRAAFVAAIADRVAESLRDYADFEVAQTADSARTIVWNAAAGTLPEPDVVTSVGSKLVDLIPDDNDPDGDETLMPKLGLLRHALDALGDPEYIDGVLTFADTDLTQTLLPRHLASRAPAPLYDPFDFERMADEAPETSHEVAYRFAVLDWLSHYDGLWIGPEEKDHLVNLNGNGARRI